MAKIILSLGEEGLARQVAQALTEGRHTVAELRPPEADGDSANYAEALLAEHGDVIVLDYWPEDAASVKLLQTVSDSENLERPAFIFLEVPGREPERDQLLMALNEGAYAFLPVGFKPAALLNYIDRALQGPGRLHSRGINPHAAPDEAEAVHRLEEALGDTRTKNSAFKKLIAHLLATPPGAQSRKVLVVSDSPYQLEMLKKILEEHSFQVLTASGPTDGLNVALSERPRIIVSDLELEGQTGIEFCQAVKLVHKIMPCHFVICTASRSRLPKVMTPGNGVDDCVIKPSGPNDTLELVSRVALGLLL